MSLNTELAGASRFMNAQVNRMPVEARPDPAELWAELAHAVEAAKSEEESTQAILTWKRSVAARLGVTR